MLDLAHEHSMIRRNLPLAMLQLLDAGGQILIGSQHPRRRTKAALPR